MGQVRRPENAADENPSVSRGRREPRLNPLRALLSSPRLIDGLANAVRPEGPRPEIPMRLNGLGITRG
jgi:hypothetical protein